MNEGSPVDTKTCPQCGAPVGDTDDFCGNCGNYLGWGTPEPTPQRQPAPTELGPVPPGRPAARRPLPTSVTEAVVAGPPCPVCGTTNPRGRRFCRHCAAPLRPAEHIPTERKRRRWRWRGDRSRWLRRLVALLVVAALVVAAVLFFPRASALREDLRDRLATPTPVSPASTSASAEVPGHPAAAAADGLSNRYWGTPSTGDSIEFTFTEPFRLLSVVLHTGATAEKDGFSSQGRPSSVDMAVTSADGMTRTLRLSLADRPGAQRTDTGISDVTRVRLVIRGVAGLAPGRHIALGEVEFFGR